jgi:hypothetical protein
MSQKSKDIYWSTKHQATTTDHATRTPSSYWPIAVDSMNSAHLSSEQTWGEVPHPQPWEIQWYLAGNADGESGWVDFVSNFPPISENVELYTLAFFATPSVNAWLAGHVWYQIWQSIESGTSKLSPICQEFFFNTCELLRLTAMSELPHSAESGEAMSVIWHYSQLSSIQRSLFASALHEYLERHGGSHEAISAYRCFWIEFFLR